MSVHQACLIAEWGPTTLYLNGAELDAESAGKLAGRGVQVEAAEVKGLEGERCALSAIELEDGRRSAIDALYISPQSCLSSPMAEQLGAEIEEGPLGPLIRTEGDKMTSVPGLYAAGDIARAPHGVSWAVADGVTAGTSVHRALVFG
jgi:thioredoxin reductase